MTTDRSAFAEIPAAFPDILLVFSSDGRVIAAHIPQNGVFVLAKDDLLGKPIYQIFSEDLAERLFSLLGLVIASKTVQSCEFRLPTPQGPHDYEMRLTPKEPDRVLAIVRNVSATKLVQQDLQRLALYDSLTGLPNRNLFMDRLDHALATARRENKRLALLLLDLTSLAQVVQRHGLAVGDILVREVVERVQQQARASDTLGRLDPSTLAVLMPGADLGAVDVVVARHSTLLSEVFEIVGLRFNCDVHMGIALHPDHSGTAEDLVIHATNAMLEARATRKTSMVHAPV